MNILLQGIFVTFGNWYPRPLFSFPGFAYISPKTIHFKTYILGSAAKALILFRVC